MEYVSHTIEPVATEPADWAGGFDTVIVTSQTAVERIARDAAHTEAFRSVLESAATADLLTVRVAYVFHHRFPAAGLDFAEFSYRFGATARILLH